MNRTTVIIPVKSSRAKSRLEGVLSVSQRRKLSKLMLADLLAVLAGSPVRTLVVSSDEDVLAMAHRRGARGVREPRDRGVNAAVRLGAGAAGAGGDLLVLPSDLPLVQGSEVRRLLSFRASGMELVIVPSRGFNGTNALLLGASTRFPFSYDSDSFWGHLRASAHLGLATGVCSARGLMFDLDTPDDLEALKRSRRRSRAVSFARGLR